MEPDVILNKLSSLSRCLSRIREKRPELADMLSRDLDLQDIISVNLERAVQICVDIASHIAADLSVRPPATMAEAFSQLSTMGVIPRELSLRMNKAVGFRNIAVHQYQHIDWEVVFLLITKHLDDFTWYMGCITAYLENEKR